MRLLVAATITYNVIEGVIAISAGTVAGSTALIGFGLDSMIEVSSAAIVAWQFSAANPKHANDSRCVSSPIRSSCSPRTWRSNRSGHCSDLAEVDHSTVGIVLASLSLLIMPFLSFAQRKAGRELGSSTAVADSKQTLLCTYLSAVLLVGLLLNSLFGWSWADPIAGLVIAVVALEEARGMARRRLLCTMKVRDRTRWSHARRRNSAWRETRCSW